MKRFVYVFAAVLAVALSIASCKKGEVAYPANLSGTWTYSNAGTGYTGELKIENIAGGQYAYFKLNSPTELVNSIEGSFIYDMSTGIGSINNTILGGSTVTVQATRGADSNLEVSVSHIVSGGSEQSFTGKFIKK